MVNPHVLNLWDTCAKFGMRVTLGLPAGGISSTLKAMHQIVFNEISAREVSAIPTLEQLELISGFKVDQAFLDGEKEDPSFGVVERDGKKIFRYRSRDYRIYFTMEDGAVVVQRVLHADSLKDFLFRSGMGSGSEDQKLGNSRSFWKLIEAGEQARRQ